MALAPFAVWKDDNVIYKSCKITVPILPFSMIDEMGAGMYKGKKVSLQRENYKRQKHKSNALVIPDERRGDTTLPP